MSIMAIIPARKGSKGIINKNIVNLNGKPLIAWSIIAAKESKNIDRIIVSTDSEEIAKVALSYGAEVPFIRPIELAQDETLGMEVVLHVVEWLASNENYVSDYTMLLQPTSPLRGSCDINNAVDLLLNDKSSSSIISVSPVSQHPNLMVEVDDSGIMKLLGDLPMGSGDRHTYSALYALNGAIYIAKTRYLESYKTWYDDSSKAYVMPRERSVDIDTKEDLVVAEYYMKNI
jgi:N-acylneuraminate cytidylyltransferase/CMP-N,N'-diacetyllegionaminic acid synthase